MKTVRPRSLIVAAVAILALVASAVAQERPSGLLNSLEMRQLVTRAEPADYVGAPEPSEKELNALAAKASTPAEHGALEEYFLTLAKQYTTEANEHVTLAQTYRGTRIALAAVHHDRLAGLSRDAAKEANEAADLHKGLAGVAR